MTFFTWSQTADDNDDADLSINLRENQAPSTYNNAVRAAMAAAAKYRDDMSGNLVTAGSSTVYTLTTNQVFTSLIDGISVVVRMDETNGATPTLNVDGLGAKAIQSKSGTAIPTAVLVGGGIYKFTYDSSADAWIVEGYFGSTFNTDNPDLAAIEALSSTGVLRRSGANTWAVDAGIGHLAATTANRLIGSDGSGVMGPATVSSPLAYSSSALSISAATTSAQGTVELATDAEMVTGTDTARPPPVSSVIRGATHPKTLCNWTQNSTQTIRADIGVSSLSDTGSGQTQLTWDTAFSSANNYPVGSGGSSSGCLSGNAFAIGTTTAEFACQNPNSGAYNDGIYCIAQGNGNW